jgi:hypothetical protein
MSKAIYFAGVSRVAGELKFRTAASPARFQQLGKLGDTDVEMVNVNCETKSQAAKELLSRNFANGRADIEALLVTVANDDNPFARPKKARTAKVKKSELVEPARDRKGRVKDIEQFYTWFNTKMKPSEAERVRAEFNERVREAYEAN